MIEVKKVARELDIEKILNKYPYELSGGQKQRVAECKSNSNKSKIILADEPLAALDSKSQKCYLKNSIF